MSLYPSGLSHECLHQHDKQIMIFFAAVFYVPEDSYHISPLVLFSSLSYKSSDNSIEPVF